MRAAGVKREYGCCIFRFRIFLTSYTRRTGNAAKAGHMRAKARLSAFKKRFFVIRNTAASRRAAPHIRRIRWHTALYTGPPARRRQPTRADRSPFACGKRGGHPPKPSRQQRAGRCGGAQRRLIRRGEQPVNIDCAADFRVRKRPANARRGSAFLIARHTDGGMQNMHSIRQLEKSAGCIANSSFFRPKSRLPARIATVTV